MLYINKQSLFKKLRYFYKKRIPSKYNGSISKFLIKIISKMGKLCIIISKKYIKHHKKKRVVPWFKIKGDENLRLDYNPNENSIVFDIGGYRVIGQVTYFQSIAL